MTKSKKFLRVISTLLTIFSICFCMTNQAYAKDNVSIDNNVHKNVTYNIETKEVTYADVIKPNKSAAGEISLPNKEFDFQSIYNGDDRVIIGNTTDSPYRNFCWIEVRYPDNTGAEGSGVLVDFNTVLTAGHVAYSHDHGGWATYMRVVPGKNEEREPFGYAYGTSMTTATEYINKIDHAYDWAIVDLSRSFDTYQAYGYYSNPSSAVNTAINVYGYADCITASVNAYNVLYRGTGKIESSNYRNFFHRADTVAGESGGPIIESGGVLIGITSADTSAGNMAVWINDDLFNRLQAHSNEKRN